MSFVSFEFFILLAVAVVGYYLLPHKFRWVLLLGVSWFFYAYLNFPLLFLLLFTTVVSYASGVIIEKTEKPSTKKIWLVITLIVSLGSLAFFKYFNFLVQSVVGFVNLFGAELGSFELYLMLPLGISFYTFQTLSYVIDVYRGKVVAEKHFGYYALFVTFFPQLVAGPIERPGDLLPQLKADNKFDKNLFRQGVAVFVRGFVKKVVIADFFAIFVNSVYNSKDLASLSALAVVVATAMFAIQVYCDFSGYSDIASGCALMLGIKLTKNFDRPFMSESITEFWSRWHITLSRWFKDYLYAPLSFKAVKSKHAKFWTCFYLILTMFLCGLWHGASWNYVVWGTLLGVFRVAEGFIIPAIKKRAKAKGKNYNALWRKILRMVATFTLICISLVFFRANTMGDAFVLFGRLFVGWGSGWKTFLSQTGLTTTFIVTSVVSVLLFNALDHPSLQIDHHLGKNNQGVSKVNSEGVVQLLWLIVIAFSLLYAMGQTNQFIYFQF